MLSLTSVGCMVHWLLKLLSKSFNKNKKKEIITWPHQFSSPNKKTKTKRMEHTAQTLKIDNERNSFLKTSQHESLFLSTLTLSLNLWFFNRKANDKEMKLVIHIYFYIHNLFSFLFHSKHSSKFHARKINLLAQDKLRCSKIKIRGIQQSQAKQVELVNNYYHEKHPTSP